VRVEVGAVQGIFEGLLGARTRELEVLTQIPSAAAKIRRDLRDPTVEDNPVLTEMDPHHIMAVAVVAKHLQP
jgi:hypothetical protein